MWGGVVKALLLLMLLCVMFERKECERLVDRVLLLSMETVVISVLT